MIEKKENIYNIPNFLTLLRVILTLFLIYFAVFRFDVGHITIFFILAALTDFFDGQIARHFSLTTNFGAKFDIIADRFLWISMGLVLILIFPYENIFDWQHLVQLFLIFSRELICLPFVLINLIYKKKVIVQARFSGKLTTLLQGFSIPILIFSVYYNLFLLSIILSIGTFISGIFAAVDYARDVKEP